MANIEITESDEVSIANLSQENWDKKLSAAKKEGARIANRLRTRGYVFQVKILAPREVGGNPSIPLAAVKIGLDWRIGAKMEMVESARDMLTKAHMLDSLSPAFPAVLASIIEGKGLYEHGIGEFFLLYGKFEQRFELSKGADTRDKMMELIHGEERYMKQYEERGEKRREPLPYAVRNILSHGNNPNTLDQEGNDLRTSIELLRKWNR